MPANAGLSYKANYAGRREGLTVGSDGGRATRLADNQRRVKKDVAWREIGTCHAIEHRRHGSGPDLVTGLTQGRQRHRQQTRVRHVVDAHDADVVWNRAAER